MASLNILLRFPIDVSATTEGESTNSIKTQNIHACRIFCTYEVFYKKYIKYLLGIKVKFFSLPLWKKYVFYLKYLHL